MATTTIASRGANSKPPPTTPSQTLYLRNLPDKLAKDDLKRSLYMLFSTYGPILDIVALKTTKMRGQAHVVFRDTNASIQALRSCQGMEFFEKKLEIQYSKTKSDTIAKLDGTFRLPSSAAAVAAEVETTKLQQSIFNAPPSGLPTKPPANANAAAAPGTQQAPTAAQGTKRPREEAEDEPMEEDEGSDMEMEESDED